MHDELSRLIARIYEASIDSTQWDGVLEGIGTLLRSPFGIFQSLDGDSYSSAFHVVRGYDDGVVEHYGRHYADSDPFMREVSRYPCGIAFTNELLPNYSTLLRSAVHNEYYVPTDQEHVIGAVLVRERSRNTGIGLRRPSRCGTFEAAERATFTRLIPHLRRSLEMRRRFEGARILRDGLDGVLSRMGEAVALVSDDARALFLNGPAERLVAKGDGVLLWNGRLAACGQDADRSLKHLIAATAQAGGGPPPTDACGLRLPRPSCGRPINVLVAPVPPSGCSEAFAGRLALVFLSDPDDAVPLLAERLADLYDLTPAECRLAAALVDGWTLREFADDAGIAESTARGTLRQVLSKTSTRRQSELVRLILTGPAALRSAGRQS